MPTAAVVGAGGRTGRECVKELLKQGYNVKAIVRRPEDYPRNAFLLDDADPATQNIQVVQGDVTDANSLREGLQDATDGIIFAASGTTYFSSDAVDYKGVSNVIQVVKDLKQARIALNLIRWRLMDKKFAGEEALRKSGIPYTIVRPGGLKNTPRGKERLVVGQGDCQTMTGISRADVAAVCVACLSSPAALASTKNTTFELTTAPAGSHGRVEGLEDQLSQLLSGLEPDS